MTAPHSLIAFRLATVNDIVDDVWKLIFRHLGTQSCGQFLVVDKKRNCLARTNVSNFYVDWDTENANEAFIYNRLYRHINSIYLASCIVSFSSIECLELSISDADTSVFDAMIALPRLANLTCSPKLLLLAETRLTPTILRVHTLYVFGGGRNQRLLPSSLHFPHLKKFRVPTHSLDPGTPTFLSPFHASILSRCPTIETLVGIQIVGINGVTDITTYPNLRTIECVAEFSSIRQVKQPFPAHLNVTLRTFSVLYHSNCLQQVINCRGVALDTLFVHFADEGYATFEETYDDNIDPFLHSLYTLRVKHLVQYGAPFRILRACRTTETDHLHNVGVKHLRFFRAYRLTMTAPVKFQPQLTHLVTLKLTHVVSAVDIVRLDVMPNLRSLTIRSSRTTSIAVARPLLIILLGFSYLENLYLDNTIPDEQSVFESLLLEILYAYGYHPRMRYVDYPFCNNVTNEPGDLEWLHLCFKECELRRKANGDYVAISDILRSPFPRPSPQRYLDMQQQLLPRLLAEEEFSLE